MYGLAPDIEPTKKVKHMMRTSFAILLVIAGTLACDADNTNRLTFTAAGYSIAPLEAAPGDGTYQSLMMFLPASNGFAPNVNVQIQHFPGTVEDYAKLTLNQFKDAKLKLIEKKAAGKSAVSFEYQGEMQARPLHWYAIALKSGNKIYLVTATDLESNWKNSAAQLKRCVNSFQLDSKGPL